MTSRVLSCSFKRQILLFLLFLLFYLANIGNAYCQTIQFQHITSNDRVSFGNVWAIAEDHAGFIWFGTEDGLYKYDGYDITPYQHNKLDSGSLSGNFIISLYTDKKHNLWIGTYGDGLNVYDHEKNTFRHFKNDPGNKHSLPNNRVKTIYESSDGTIWIGTEGGGIATLNVNDPNDLASGRFNVLSQDSTTGIASLFIRSIVEDKKTLQMYVGTFDKGFYVLDRNKKVIQHFQNDKKNADALNSDEILKLFFDSRNRLWIGTADKGVDLYLPEQRKFKHYQPADSAHTLCNKEAETIIEDDMGLIWIGTDNGISILRDSKSQIPKDFFDNLRHEPLDEHSMLSNSVKSMFADSRKSVWAGTYFGGINVFNRNLFKFYPIHAKPWLTSALSDNNVTSFAEDSKGNLWVGTDAGGLNFLPNARATIYQDVYRHIPIRNPVTKKFEAKVKSIAVDKNDFVWIGLWADGLYRLDPKDYTTTYLSLDDASIFHGANVLQIKVDQKNNLWIGTFGDGIFYYDQEKKLLTRYQTNPKKENALTSERIRTMLVDSKNRLWVGGDVGGLNVFNEGTQSFERIEYSNVLTKNSTIINLMESHDGKIWIGTVSSGAIVYDPANKKAWAEDRDSTMADHVINAMLEDRHGQIWMSTSNGIRKYDPQNKTSIIYTKDDGLQGNHFNSGSALRSSDGMLFFGGINGWNAFYPDSIRVNQTLPKITFTKFWINNTPIDVNTPNSPLKTSINTVGNITLDYSQNSFSIEFAALEYNFSKKTKYAYMLEPFNDRWQYINDERKITFTNLFPGQYVLKIKATNLDGIWVTKEKPLIITVQPAWWQSTAFRAIGALLILIFFYLLFRIRLAYLIRQRKRLTQEIQFHTAELKSKNYELAELNGEILSQNEELTAQNEQIITQREELEVTQRRLQASNEHLEELVKLRTQKLEDTIRKLDKTVSELDRFVYSASHDLSAPLKSVLGLVNIAKVETDQKLVAQYYEYIELSILKLERVIKNLVEFSRNSHLEIRISAFTFSELVRDVMQELAFWPEAQKVKIITTPDTAVQIVSDEQRMKVILHNLIGNAIKYADMTKTESYIKIDCQQKGSSWFIHITDNGIGIDEKYLGKVFEMYYRATDRSQGSGLGLFIVREIVHKLGGEITIESARGKGTDFCIALPVIELVNA